jgi:hypothetical protein
MATQQFALGALPAAPTGKCPQVRRARKYLEATHQSVSGLLDSFNVVHEKTVTSRTNAQGRLSRDELDLLRAALVFTSSGLDASCHTLVGECIPVLVDRPGSTAAKKFDLYLDEQSVKRTDEFRAALKDRDPRTKFIDLYVTAKTKASYQGTEDLKDRVRDLLGIPNKTVATKRVDGLSGFFIARNDIVHRLDYVDPRSTSVKRHHRSPSDVVAECDRVLALVADLIRGAAEAVQAK